MNYVKNKIIIKIIIKIKKLISLEVKRQIYITYSPLECN